MRLMAPLFDYDFSFHIQAPNNCWAVSARRQMNFRKYLNNTHVILGRQVVNPWILSVLQKIKVERRIPYE